MLQFKSLSYAQGPHTLVEQANVTIERGSRVGLIGANGSGKSSLFQVILNQIEIESGACLIPKNSTINHIAQEAPSSAQAAIEFVLDGYQRYRDLEQAITQAAQRGEYEAQLKHLDTFEAIGGEQIKVQAAKILHGLGFSEQQQSQPVNAFSGGWRVRLQLARTLLSPCDILLMDEPTNHLDLEAILWLEKWCQMFSGTLIIIAHDIAFLDNVVTDILHIENKTIQMYKGNYSTFVKTRAERLLLNEKLRQKQLKEKAHLESFINRFRAKASKAKQAQSRIKRLERMQDIAAMHATTPVQFRFSEVDAPTPLIRISQGVLGYDDTPLLSHISFYLGPGDRIALLGKNGQGKSTLVKCLAQNLALMQGDHYVADKLRVGYFAQHQVEALKLSQTPFDLIQSHEPQWREQAIRDFLGRFQFNKDKVFNLIGELSGGERARLALAILVLKAPQVILLDEPTNHLDVEMREALALALQDFNGALVVVSHDRAFIEATCDKLVLIDNGRVSDYHDTLADYAKLSSTQSVKDKSTKKPSGDRKQAKRLANTIQSLERDIHKLEQQLKDLDALLADDSLYEVEADLKATLDKREGLQALLVEKEQLWEQSQEALERGDYD